MSVCLGSAVACTGNLYHSFIHWSLIIRKEIARTKAMISLIRAFFKICFEIESDKLSVVSDPPYLLVR